MERFVMMRFGRFRFGQAVKLGSGWAAFGQAGRGLVRYGGQGNSSYVEPWRVPFG
jgi:hypothetical protein